jgi:DNA-binding NarL/FixJ family response regulator
MNSIPSTKSLPRSGADSITIFVIANKAIYVDGLVRVISDHARHEVLACSNPGDTNCFEEFSKQPADILLVEQSTVEERLESIAHEQVFAEFLQQYPGLRIIIFGHDLVEPFVRKMVRAGVRGFIDTNATQETLITAIGEVYSGGYWVSRKALEQMILNSVEMEQIVEQGIRNKIETIQSTLTRREIDVLRCVLAGMSTREISGELCISEQSVKLYLGRMFKKFEVSNRSQLILMAFQRVCPANNMIQLFRRSLDKRRIRNGQDPLIKDPLSEMR